MKLNQKQKDLASEICDELEMSGDISIFEKDICKLFPEFKEEFQLMCKLKRKYERKFEKIGDAVWSEEVDEYAKESA